MQGLQYLSASSIYDCIRRVSHVAAHLAPPVLLITNPLQILTVPFTIPSQTTDTRFLSLVNLRMRINLPRRRQHHRSRIPKLNSLHLPFRRFPLRSSEQRRDSIHDRRALHIHDAVFRSGGEVLRGVAFDREAQNVKRVRVVVGRVRPHARPNTPGAAAGGDLYKSAFRFWIAVVELFRDELFACVVPGESCDVG